jgi:hypothetical protein
LREYFKDMSVDRIYVIKEGYGILPFQFPRISQTKRI